MPTAESLKGVHVFVAVAAAGSFTAAAERLHLTKSAVGKAVGRLEDRLGTRLLDRTTRTMSLTEAGAAFHATCVRVLADLDDAEAILSAHTSEPVGRLRIDAGSSFGRLRVLPLLLDFASKHPRVQPHMTFTDRFVDLVEDGIDVAVRIGGPERWPAAIGFRRLAAERLVFCAAPAYLAGRGTPRAVEDLSTHDAVVYGKSDGTVAPWVIAGASAISHEAQAHRMIIGHGEAQVAAVRAGFGIAQLATWLVADDLARGDLVEVLPERTTDGLPLYLLWQKSRKRVPKVAAALDLFGSSLRID